MAAGPSDATARLSAPEHRAFLLADARRQLDFFRASPRSDGGFHLLDHDGTPLPTTVQELHTTTRLVHSYALGKLAGFDDCEGMIAQGMDYLQTRHHDPVHGGYVWALDGDAIADGRKLAYGHVFVMLAAASAHMAGHPGALDLLEDADDVLRTRFWEPGPGLFCDEWNRDWTPFSDYRGLNANMHGVEALLAAFEATGRPRYLEQADSILSFFTDHVAAAHDWRMPEHYTPRWRIDHDYKGDPMFRPEGTTPGHSFELARLLLQYWDLSGRPEGDYVDRARMIVYRALEDAWDSSAGGLVYTLGYDGQPDIANRYWWPVTEAIGALAALLKLGGTDTDGQWYSQLWAFAGMHFIDHRLGGWFPEIDAEGRPTTSLFAGKPDIYHALQADLFPLTDRLSRIPQALQGIAKA